MQLCKLVGNYEVVVRNDEDWLFKTEVYDATNHALLESSKGWSTPEHAQEAGIVSAQTLFVTS